MPELKNDEQNGKPQPEHRPKIGRSADAGTRTEPESEHDHTHHEPGEDDRLLRRDEGGQDTRPAGRACSAVAPGASWAAGLPYATIC